MDAINELKVLFVVPCFNEESRLDQEAFLNYVSENPTVCFLFVDDGSRDKTSTVLKSLCSKSSNLNFLILENNGGKAEAIRKGILSLEDPIDTYDYVGYLDADLSTPLSELKGVFKEIQNNTNIKFLMGIRISRLGAEIFRLKSRHYVGRVFATAVSMMLNLPVYDSQCGMKLLDSKIAQVLFRDRFVSKWLFDVELLIRLRQIDYKIEDVVFEHPLRKWEDVAGSKVNFVDVLKAPFQLFKMFFSYNKYL